jgi:DNA-directed RNA polymerase subunit RPC12/RpoP
MKKLIFISFFALINLFSSSDYTSSQVCKTCHPIIYDEHFSSSHRNSSIFNDPVHKAIWDKHPAKKKEAYKCAKCHTPTDTKLLKKLSLNEPALPEQNEIQTKEAIACVYCHKIKNVETHEISNNNIISSKEKLLFSARDGEENDSDFSYKIKKEYLGLVTTKSGSPFHDVDFTNENFYNGNICLGCHSHKQNSHSFNVCKTESEEKNTKKENCISCHMPKVQGSFTTAVDSKTHRYHGFTGVSNNPQMLAKYVNFSFEKSDNGFSITIKNEANHQLLLHPLRVGELRVTILRDKEVIKLQENKFIRVIGKDGKPSMPWLADSIIKDNHIKAKESRKIDYNEPLKKGDIVEVELGHYKVNPKVAKKLGLERYKDLTKFTLFKKERFHVK